MTENLNLTGAMLPGRQGQHGLIEAPAPMKTCAGKSSQKSGRHRPGRYAVPNDLSIGRGFQLFAKRSNLQQFRVVIPVDTNHNWKNFVQFFHNLF